MERRSDAMAHEFANDPVFLALRDGLDGHPDVADAPADPHGLDPGEKGCVRRVDQFPYRSGRRLEHDRTGGVRVVAVDDGAQVEPHDVARLEDALRRRNAVHDLVIDRDAERLRIAAIARKRGLSAARRDAGRRDAVDLLGRPAGPACRDALGQRLVHDAGGVLHLEDLGLALAGDHAVPLRARARAAATSAATVSTERSPSIATRRPAWRYRSARGAVFSR